jgi:hypothetical protein
MVMLSLLLACGGASLETRVDELRVMAIQTVPAEISPFEPVELNLLIPNPRKTRGQILFWTCTNFGDGCLEREYYESVNEDWGSVQTITNSPVHNYTLDVPPVVGALLSELPQEDVFGATFLWVLACEENACPLIDNWTDGTPDLDAMSDPFSLMKNLPIEGTSLAFRPLLLSNRDPADRIEHPSFERSSAEEISLSGPKDSQEILFNYTLNRKDEASDALFYAYATQGGFQMNDRYNALLTEESGTFTADWFGTDDLESGEALLMVILENGEGGISFWTYFTDIK